MPLKLVWGVTGSGDLMPEIVDVMVDIRRTQDVEITAALSQAAVQVLRWYKLQDRVEEHMDRVLVEKNANSPFIVGKLQVGEFDGFIVAPVTANSTAKIANGIADTLITNAVAQTNKTDLPVYILPVDREPGTATTVLPNGEQFTLKIRDVDVENAARLASLEGIRVIGSPGEIYEAVDAYRARLEGH